MNPLERYRAMIPDWEDFRDTMLRRDPPTLRVRTGRISSASLRDRLQAQGFVLSEVEGLPDFLRVIDGPHAVADTFENWLGLFYIQQASTGMAAPLLAPRPGERILDLCAAPGGKTTHAADLMQDRGCIVAVDRNEDRIRALLGNMYRTAHPNVLVVAGDGRSLPDGALFDRVLVDAPCSAEGTLRRKHGKPRGQTAKFRRQAPRRQEALLRRAIALTRPGGTVLYSTCTFAPEENEAVVDRVLRDAPVTLEPITIDAPHAPGLTSFEGQTFDSSLEGACRIYPHHFDSGGLFLARLKRFGGDEPVGSVADSAAGLPGWSPVPAAFPDGRKDPQAAAETIEAGFDRLESLFGIGADVRSDFGWIVRGEDIWVHRCEGWPLGSWTESDHWRVVSVGLRAMVPDYRNRPRPTNDLFRLFEEAILPKLVPLSVDQWTTLLSGEDVGVPGVQSGFVPLGLQGHVVGRGLVRGETVQHEIPKVPARWLAKILELVSSRSTSGLGERSAGNPEEILHDETGVARGEVERR
jgi:NOL1/NOP2/sun family putative RNA methylase